MKKIVEYYDDLYSKYGITEKSLGWTKNKQDIRFKQLLRFMDFSEKGKMLDIGCGFGDAYDYVCKNIKCNIEYSGIDIMPQFIDYANSKYTNKGDADYPKFILDDFMQFEDKNKYDYIIASGIFGHKLYYNDKDNYDYIDKAFEKCMTLCKKDGVVAVNFLSDKVDYHTSEEDFHAAPEKILAIAYNHSRNIILDNSVMPFEYSITIFKNDEFVKEKTIFLRYINKNHR